jgi:hypothetical protein
MLFSADPSLPLGFRCESHETNASLTVLQEAIQK